MTPRCGDKMPESDRHSRRGDNWTEWARLARVMVCPEKDQAERPVRHAAPARNSRVIRITTWSGASSSVLKRSAKILGRRITISWRSRETFPARSLRGRNDRSEKVENRGQIFTILRCIVVLFAEKSGKYGPILRFRSRLISAAQAPRPNNSSASYSRSVASRRMVCSGGGGVWHNMVQGIAIGYTCSYGTLQG